MACVDQLGEQHRTHRTLRTHREVADLVDHQKRRMSQHPQAAGQLSSGLRLGQRFDQPCQRAIVDSASRLGGPSRMTLTRRPRNPSSCRLSIWSRLMLGWKAKSKWAKVLSAGSRDDRIAVSRRRLLRSTMYDASSFSIATARTPRRCRPRPGCHPPPPGRRAFSDRPGWPATAHAGRRSALSSNCLHIDAQRATFHRNGRVREPAQCRAGRWCGADPPIGALGQRLKSPRSSRSKRSSGRSPVVP